MIQNQKPRFSPLYIEEGETMWRNLQNEMKEKIFECKLAIIHFSIYSKPELHTIKTKWEWGRRTEKGKLVSVG